MTGKEIKEEVDNYLIKTREERKNAGLAKVPEFDERDVKQAYRDGLQSGLWHHSYDYLVKTADLKKRYKTQKEINKELVDENAELKGSLKKWKDAIYADVENYNDQLTKAKELLAKWVELFKPKVGNIPPTLIQVETEQFLNEVEK